jgi:superfamily II DNA/RNA helicase
MNIAYLDCVVYMDCCCLAEILEEISRAGFEKPTPIQSQGWPVVMQGLDMVGIAQTGTGKTLVFLLPGFIHIMGQSTYGFLQWITPFSEYVTVSCLVP